MYLGFWKGLEMSGNVKSLFGGPTGVPEPNETCISQLEEMLEMAKAGEIIGVSVAAVTKDGLALYRLAGLVGGFSMLGAMDVAKAELIDLNRGIE